MSVARPTSGSGHALVEEVLAAHGGANRWKALDAIDAKVSATGMVMALKGQSTALRDIRLHMDCGTQRGHLSGTEPTPWRYEINPASLRDDLDRLNRWPRPWRWTPHDAGTFAAAALWTYLQLPFHLLDPGVSVERLNDRRGLRRLRIRFPQRISTHCPSQTLHIDTDGRIRHHEYTALVVGRWARPIQHVGDYRAVNGISFPSSRIVVPRAFGRPLPGPRLIHITIGEVRFTPKSDTSEPVRAGDSSAP